MWCVCTHSDASEVVSGGTFEKVSRNLRCGVVVRNKERKFALNVNESLPQANPSAASACMSPSCTTWGQSCCVTMASRIGAGVDGSEIRATEYRIIRFMCQASRSKQTTPRE